MSDRASAVLVICFQKEEEARVREEADRARQERENHFQREEQEHLERKKVGPGQGSEPQPHGSASFLGLDLPEQKVRKKMSFPCPRNGPQY